MGLLDFFPFKKKVDRIVVTDDSIMQFRADGTQEFMHWDDLVEVGILTGGGEPWVEGVHLILVASGGKTGISVLQGAEGVDRLLAALKKLPGFDNEVLKQALGSTSVERFVCWQRGVPPCVAPDDGADFSDKWFGDKYTVPGIPALAAMQKLPGFDKEALAQAMGSTSVERFVCWQRSVRPCVKAIDDRAIETSEENV